MFPDLPSGFSVLLFHERIWRSVGMPDLSVYLHYKEQDADFLGDWYLLQATSSDFVLSTAFRELGPKRLVIAASEWVEFRSFRLRASALFSRRHQGKRVVRAPCFICDDCKRVIRAAVWPCDCRKGEQSVLKLVA